MAKGNMFQGMARGKVGDIVFSRLDGQQISRVRNRNPKNPRSNAQLYQRAIMATVMQAYSAGKEILDHSFQGKSVGAANQRHFLSINAKKLRETIAAEIAAGTAIGSQLGRVVAPGVKTPVPSTFIVSEGSLVNIVNNNCFPESNVGETVAQYCSRNGIVSDDLFTFVGFEAYTNEDPIFAVNGQTDVHSKQYPCRFVAVRMAVKSDALTNTAEIINMGQFLEVTKVINCTAPDISGMAIGDKMDFENFLGSETYQGSNGVIRSRANEDLRSSETLKFENMSYGIATSYALTAWKQGTVLVGDSNLILEGGDNDNVL